jgi:hypothetical protein
MRPAASTRTPASPPAAEPPDPPASTVARRKRSMRLQAVPLSSAAAIYEAATGALWGSRGGANGGLRVGTVGCVGWRGCGGWGGRVGTGWAHALDVEERRPRAAYHGCVCGPQAGLAGHGCKRLKTSAALRAPRASHLQHVAKQEGLEVRVLAQRRAQRSVHKARHVSRRQRQPQRPQAGHALARLLGGLLGSGRTGIAGRNVAARRPGRVG